MTLPRPLDLATQGLKECYFLEVVVILSVIYLLIADNFLAFKGANAIRFRLAGAMDHAIFDSPTQDLAELHRQPVQTQ